MFPDIQEALECGCCPIAGSSVCTITYKFSWLTFKFGRQVMDFILTKHLLIWWMKWGFSTEIGFLVQVPVQVPALGNSLSTCPWARHRNPKRLERLLKAAFSLILFLINSKIWQFPPWDQQIFFVFFQSFILTLSQLFHLSVTIKTRHFL